MDILQDWEVFQTILDWLDAHGLPLLLIIVGAALAKRVNIWPLKGVIRRTVKTSRFQNEAEHRQREETLLDISRGIFGLFVWIVAFILLLVELEINLSPILAAGGVIGIVIGFGAQNILRDVFAGVYVITENQYQIGDVIDLDGDWGVVEDITLRYVSLRDLDGAVHHIPHSTVDRVKNLSKDFGRINLDIGVSYGSDINQVIKVVDRIGKELADDEDWREIIITPPQFWRVDNFSDSSIEVKIVGETTPLMQWSAAGEYRKRLKNAFDEEGIEIPFPQRVIHTNQKNPKDT
ncbi:mechanosensitive ion channel family protein [Candidatus Saccharibacteria bacterium QS_5_54_17]|nr:MAG: mechanosensitive ion channel family protein [Candidatus Saccharibacteria bacterium QS_5_54_17]